MAHYPGKLKFKAAQDAYDMYRETYPGYATYIQNSLENDVEKGIRTLEEAQNISLGHLLQGNDGI